MPIQTIVQFPSSLPVETRRLAHAMTIRLFPVKSSAPATTTRIRPSVNDEPGEQAHDAEGQRAPAGGDGRGEDRAERDERAREHSEDEELERGQARLRDPDGLGLARDVGRGEGIEPDGREGRLGHPGDFVS